LISLGQISMARGGVGLRLKCILWVAGSHRTIVGLWDLGSKMSIILSERCLQKATGPQHRF
jgi:hypothetical protein